MKRRTTHIILALFWITTVVLTWGIVENPLYDFATCLHAAERFALGQTPYRDVVWMYPPLSLWTYGTIMKLFHDSYVAVTAFSSLIALSLLIAEYRLARLILRRTPALACAIGAYGGIFSVSSASGENFISFGFVYMGVALFAWFVWSVAQGFILRKGQGYILVASVLGAVSTLNKHEQVIGVCAVSLFLVIREVVIRQRSWRLLLMFGSTLFVIAAAGYGWVIGRCGAANLWASLTAYGTLSEHAQRTLPSGVQVWQQVLLFGGYAALTITLGVVWTNRLKTGDRTCSQTSSKILFALWFAVICGTAAEIVRVGLSLQHHTLGSTDGVPQTIALAGQYAKQTPDISSIAFYLGSILCRSIVPVFILFLIFGGVIVCRMYKHGIRRSLLSRQAILLLLCLSGLGLQARGQFAFSAYGSFDMALPLAMFLGPVFLKNVQGVKWSHGYQNTFRIRLGLALLIICLSLAAALYAYEFRAARFTALTMETDKGLIRLPNTPENAALKDMVEFVRSNRLENIIVLPYWGIQYWTGHSAFPSWPGLIHPATYHDPWSTYLDEEIRGTEVTFVVFDKLDVNYLAFPTHHRDLWDGPWFKPYRWKTAFPELWSEVANHSVLRASFGPKNGTFFSVYTHSPSSTLPSSQ